MEIIANTLDFELHIPTAVAIGKFDGLHIGHRRLLEEILAKKQQGMAACVFTFDPSPGAFFGLTDGRELTTREEKRALLQELGVDILVEFPLNERTAATPPREFIREILVRRMYTAWVAAGEDVSFGRGGAGNAQLLKELSQEGGYGVTVIEKIRLEGREVSSTGVRSCVEAGRMPQAERLLGMPYTFLGRVERGRALGRELGMPTVNLVPPPSKLLPPRGVYRSRVMLGGRSYRAVSNVGCRPTVVEDSGAVVESYLYEFDREAYGEEAAVGLLEFLRPERRFENLEALRAQLERDKAAAWG